MKLLIKGMSCGHCQKAVFNALSDIEGVFNVEVSLEENCATFDADTSLKTTLVKAIEEEGYTVVEVI